MNKNFIPFIKYCTLKWEWYDSMHSIMHKSIWKMLYTIYIKQHRSLAVQTKHCMLKWYSYLDSRWSFQSVAVSIAWCIVGWMVILVSDTVLPLRFCSSGMSDWILHPHPVTLQQTEFCVLLSLMVLLYRPHQTIQLFIEDKRLLVSSEWTMMLGNMKPSEE